MRNPIWKYNSRICKIIRRNGVVLYPFIFIAKKESEMPDIIRVHELVHWAQIERMGVYIS